MLWHPTHAVWAMAFRPFYLLAAGWGAVAVLLWGFGFRGTVSLPGVYWHAHEMIWGYAAAVVVGFLLTASASWTGQPPVRGKLLMALAAAWLTARTAALLPQGALWSGVAGTIFFALALYSLGKPVWHCRNRRNYFTVAALALFAATHTAFHAGLPPGSTMRAGLMTVAGFIGLMGSRVIPFFTARRLGGTQAAASWQNQAAMLLPLLAGLSLSLEQTLLARLTGTGFAAIAAWQLRRWWHKDVWREPLLWTLFAGYAMTAAGVALTAAAPHTGAGTHLIAVGGIGLLTLSMMTRTALGHTGRPLYPAPRPMPQAFILMTAAALLRVAATWLGGNAYLHTIRLSAALFACALLLYLSRYLTWLLRPRCDGKTG
ncbi:NnrS family protein [Conchiformibius kuhniae]|uniref:NnrS family protein n=1 Tax=Conchiformibius kuhniae TaxID=211502 RepID=A0A8T9MZ64_9NEIS|nr:NnrS family protein [Conchiformibius kuhniae]